MASIGHLPFPLPKVLTFVADSASVKTSGKACLLDTFGPESGLSLIENLTVMWSNDYRYDQVHAGWLRWINHLRLLNMGFIGIGNEQRHGSKKKDPLRRIGNDTIDWSSQDEVLEAYQAALPVHIFRHQHGAYSTKRRWVHDNSAIPWNFPMVEIQDMVRVMRLFKERYPKAMTWVEVKIEVPDIALFKVQCAIHRDTFVLTSFALGCLPR